MNDDIDKADRIVGLTIAINHDWGCPSLNSWRDKIRRGSYAEWFAKNTQRDQWPNLNETIASQAERIVRLDAEERRTKASDDGLPPGPWTHDYTNGVVVSADGKSIMHGDVFGRYANVMSYFVRCGSPAVRRLLAAYDVTEERVNDNSRALVRYPSGVAETFFIPSLTREILCWLTPRSKP